MRTPFAPALAAILVLSALPHAQTGGPCPEQRASLVPAVSQELLPVRTCFLRVFVLGVWISIPNGRCPSGHTYVPAHEECLGEYGAVAVVHGYKQTATLQVQDYYENFNQEGAYAVSLMLAVVAVIVLISMILLKPKEAHA